MRRPPKSRHTIAAIILLAVSVLAGFHASMQTQSSTRQHLRAAMVVAADDPDAFANDALLGNQRLKDLSNPLWLWFIGQMRISSGDDYNIASWFAPMVGPLTAIYLLGMYGLLWKQSKSWKAACTAAILSLVIIEPVKNMPWGMGSVHIIDAESVVMAFVPLCAWLLWINWPRPMLLWGFLGIGVLANFDFVSAISLALVLTVTRLGTHFFTKREWMITPLGLLAAIAAAAPSLFRWAGAADGQHGIFETLAAAMALNSAAITDSSTKVVMGLFELPTIVRLLALLIPGVIAAIGFERFRTPNRRLWLTLTLGCAALVAVFIALSNIFKPANSLFLSFAANIMRLVMLAIYVLFTQAMVNFSRSGLRHAICWIFVLFSLCWLIPSDNLSAPRHKVEKFAASFMPPESKPRNVLNRQRRQEKQEELKAIGLWLRKNTSRKTKIICNESELRIYANRPLDMTDDDLEIFSLIAQTKTQELRQRLNLQRNLIEPADGKLDIDALKKYMLDNNATIAVITAVDPKTINNTGENWPLLSDKPQSQRVNLFVLP